MKKTWIEPAIDALDLAQTAMDIKPGTDADGGIYHGEDTWECFCS